MQKYFSLSSENIYNQNHKPYMNHLSIYAKIMSDTYKCIKYAQINKNIELSNLNLGAKIVAFIKNFRKDVIFCSLNLGISGIIRDEDSRRILEKYNSFGDLIWVTVLGFESHKGQALLTFSSQYTVPANMDYSQQYMYHQSN